MTRIATLILAAALALAAVGCSSSTSSGGPSSPNVDGSKQVSAVSASERTSMCDWFAGLVGGYGAASACPMAVITAPPSQDGCLADFPSCAVTVATFEVCVNDLVAAQATCTAQAMMTAQQSAACQMVGLAACFN